MIAEAKLSIECLAGLVLGSVPYGSTGLLTASILIPQNVYRIISGCYTLGYTSNYVRKHYLDFTYSNKVSTIYKIGDITANACIIGLGTTINNILHHEEL